MKANEKMTKLYQQALEEGSESEKEADEVKSDQNEERKQEERKAEFQANPAEVDASYEIKKKAVSEKIVFESQGEKPHVMNMPRGQSFQMNQGVAQKPVEIKINGEPDEVKREYLTQKSQEAGPKKSLDQSQEPTLKFEEKKQQVEHTKDSHEIERYKSDPTGKMPEFIRRNNPKSNTQTQIHGHVHDEETRSMEMKRTSEDISHPILPQYNFFYVMMRRI